MDNWIFDLLQLPEECVAEEILPKDFFSKNFTLTTGENNLLSYNVDEIAIVGALGPDFGAIPATEAMPSAAILVVETKGGKFHKNASKIAQLLQKLIPQYMIIGLTDGEMACVNIASKSVNSSDELELEDSFSSPIFSPDKLEELSQSLSFNQRSKDDLSTLWQSYIDAIKGIA